MNKTIIFKEYTLLSSKENIELLEIRNSKIVKDMSLNSESISLSSHLSWIESLKENEDKKYFAIINSNKIIGAINIIDIKNEIKWGVFFEKEASFLIKSFTPIYFISLVFSKYQINTLTAQVKTNNENALLYNKNLGFEIFETKNGIISLKLEKESFVKRKDGKILKRIIKKMNSYEFIIKEYSER